VALTQLIPRNGPVSGSTVVTIVGSGFTTSSASVLVNGTDYSGIVQSTTAIKLTTTPAMFTGPGGYSVDVSLNGVNRTNTPLVFSAYGTFYLVSHAVIDDGQPFRLC